jgi:hypothetical protein
MTKTARKSSGFLLPGVQAACALLVACTSTYVPPPQDAGPSSSLRQAREDVKQVLLAGPGRQYSVGGASVTDVRFRSNKLILVLNGNPLTLPTAKLAPSAESMWFWDVFMPVGTCKIYLTEDHENGVMMFNSGVNTGCDADTNRIVDALRTLRVASKDGSQIEQAAFARVVAEYRAASPKPGPTEEVRKFQVQGEGAIRDKDFAGAEDCFAAGIAVAPWYPPFHYNRALVLAELGDYDQAALEMQRYLALSPDAANARAVQDRIYDWERRATASR